MKKPGLTSFLGLGFFCALILSGCVTMEALTGKTIDVSAIRVGASREEIETHLGRACGWGTKLSTGDGYVYRYPPELDPDYHAKQIEDRWIVSLMPFLGGIFVAVEELSRGCLPANPGYLITYGPDSRATAVSRLPPGGYAESSPLWVRPQHKPVYDN